MALQPKQGAKSVATSNVEDLTHRLDQMEVGMRERHLGQDHNLNGLATSHSNYTRGDQQMSIDEENIQPDEAMDLATRSSAFDRDNSREENETQILIVTRLDPRVFSEPSLRANFESLVRQYDEQVSFRYLKSFRRVRLDFTSPKRAENARSNLNNCQLGNTCFRCYPAQIIRPNFNSNNDSNSNPNDQEARIQYQGNENSGGYLNIPKLTRQHLISPPMSPPVDWEPKEESTPCIDVQLLSAIANLVPGQTHEIHAGNESQPGIYVEVCEEPHFETMTQLSCRAARLPKTMIPGTPRPECRTDADSAPRPTDCFEMES